MAVAAATSASILNIMLLLPTSACILSGDHVLITCVRGLRLCVPAPVTTIQARPLLLLLLKGRRL